MATVQQTIEINVPVQILYNQLTQFEDYPNFMDEVKAVKQIDDTHMHWVTMMANRPVEWDAEIIEQEPDRCIAWHNTSGPTNGGRIEVQPIGADASCVTFTLQSMPEQVPGSMAGESEDEMAQRLKFDLVRLKEFLEGRGSATGAWRGEVHDAELTLRDRDAREQGSGEPRMAAAGQAADTQAGRGSPRNSPIPASSYAAGSEGFAGDEEPGAPSTSSMMSPTQNAAAQRNDSAGPASPGRLAASAGTPTSEASAQPAQAAAGSGAPAAEPDRSQPSGGGTAAVVGAAGGTDAAAGARMAGKPATKSTGGGNTSR